MLKTITRRNFWVMFVADALLVGLSFYLAYLLRFDGSIPASYFQGFAKIIFWVVPVKLASLIFFGSYKGMWRYTGIYDLQSLIKACVFSTAVIVSVLVLKVRFEGFPRSVFAIDLLLTFLFLAGVRIGIRLLLTPGQGRTVVSGQGEDRRTEDGGQRTEDGGRRTEGRGRRAEGRLGVG